MEATSFLSSSSSFTLSSLPSALLPQHLHHKAMFSVLVNPKTCQMAVSRKNLSFCTKATLRGNVQATGVPTSVPVRVAHELYQAGHRYLDVRTPEEFSAGHVPGAINIPYMHKLASGLAKNPSFLAEVSEHFGKYDELIVGCQLVKRSLMAATDFIAAVACKHIKLSFFKLSELVLNQPLFLYIELENKHIGLVGFRVWLYWCHRHCRRVCGMDSERASERMMML